MSEITSIIDVDQLESYFEEHGELPHGLEQSLLTLARRALEQPVPTGEIEALARDFTSPSRATELAGYIATREQAAHQRGRKSAQGGWVAVYGRQLQGMLHEAGRNHDDYSCGKSFALSAALALFAKLAPPPPSDPSKGGGT